VSIFKQSLPGIAALLIRGLGRTWRVRRIGRVELAPMPLQTQRVVYAAWHRSVLINAFVHRDCGVCVGVSEHADGEWAARISESLGFATARGSSTRGSLRLLRELLLLADQQVSSIALTPDGPKGPARQSKPGVLYFASRLGWPLVPIATAASPMKELRSWDRFSIPLPLARVVVAYGEPLILSRDEKDDQLLARAKDLDRALNSLEESARAAL